MKFVYSGFDKAGKPVRASIDAADKNEAAETLVRQGIYATELHAEGGVTTRKDGPGHHRRRRPGASGRLECVAGFTRQLSILVSTGTPLVDAIQSLEKQHPEGDWRSCLADVRERLEEGTQLSEAMAAHPEYFDGVCRSLVAAGESGGKLDAMLLRLAAFTRQQVKIRKTVSGAMVYPCLLICVAIVVSIAMLTFVLPRFEGLFKTLDTPLPPMTRVLMDLSGLIRTYWYIALGLGLGGPVAAVAFIRSARGRVQVERLAMRAPQVGRMMRGFATARMARVLGVLLDGKVNMLEALRLTRMSTNNTSYQELMARAEEAITRGENVSVALNEPSLIAPSVIEAIRSGERSGQVAPVLLSVADFMDEDNEVALKTVTGLLEPVILILMGLVVGAMAISMFLPLFDLTAAGGHGG